MLRLFRATRLVIISVMVATLFNGTASAAEVEKDPTSFSVQNLGKTFSSLASASKSFAFESMDGRKYLKLGTDYFSEPQNQNVQMKSVLGECITTAQGCWSPELRSYIPILVNLSETSASSKTSPDKYSIVNASYKASTPLVIENASAWNWALAGLSVVTALAGTVMVLPTVLPAVVVGATVMRLAAATLAVGGLATAGVTVCKAARGCI